LSLRGSGNPSLEDRFERNDDVGEGGEWFGDLFLYGCEILLNDKLVIVGSFGDAVDTELLVIEKFFDWVKVSILLFILRAVKMCCRFSFGGDSPNSI
jgi:hypothetical protein